jgi:hypothetical protein
MTTYPPRITRQGHRDIAERILGSGGSPGTIPGEQGPGKEIAVILEALAHATLANQPNPPVRGIVYHADVRGPSREALEAAALDMAREFFGTEAKVETVGNYSVVPNVAAGYRATITVRELPGDPR